jgi:predicted kinase
LQPNRELLKMLAEKANQLLAKGDLSLNDVTLLRHSQEIKYSNTIW